MIDSKKIAKNTVFMYFRMILIMGVTLYTSRVVLDKLGVDDYALYNVIFSLIGMLSFLNGTLSISTSRFITFELGTNNFNSLRRTFSTAVFTHFVLACLILLIGETLGLWYVNNILVVDPERLIAAKIIYQISIISTCIIILQVPYTSTIIAHERMGIYAYIGIFESISKLLIVFVLSNTHFDKLILYAAMLSVVNLIVFIIYIVFCYRLFEETRKLISPEKKMFKSILQFSGWNIVANISNTLLNEGVILLFNVFFQPFVVASQGIAKQISSALMNFVNNVRVAVNPQITKLYANGSYEESKKLTLRSAELIFYLLLLLGVPCIIVMPTLLKLWLVDVPEYAVVFARLIVIQNILDNFNAAFYTPMTAANKIKKNSTAAVIVCFTQFLLLYFLFKLGCSPMWAFYLGILSCIIFSYIIKPYILYKDIGYTLKEIYSSIYHCLKVGGLVAVLSIILFNIIPQNNISNVILLMFMTVIVIVFSIWLLLDRELRNNLYTYIKRKLVRNH